MKKFFSLIFFLSVLIIQTASPQDIQVVVHRTFIDSTLGSEMIFDFEVINVSSFQQTVFEVRTINNLPADWLSSLCFGLSCFSPLTDSVATTPDFFANPLEPGDTLITSLHVWAFNNNGTANVQVQVGTFRNPNDRITIDFTATTIPVSVEDETVAVEKFFIEQNYPNPFNPSTKIKYGIAKAGNVEISVYNILGSKVASLVNGFKPAGTYSVNFDASKLSSGIYFYKITANGFVQTKKMILEK